MAEGEKEIAMKLNLGGTFFEHLQKMSETTSKISEPGQVTNFKMETKFLEAMLWEYIQQSGEINYYEKVDGWKDIEKERSTVNNKLEQKKLGDNGVNEKKQKLDIEESLLKIKGLMGFAVKQNIAPGYKPAEKKIGLNSGG